MSQATANKITGNVYVTTKYDQFQYLDGNRDVSDARYKKIETSMLLKQLPIPIVVNEKYEVIDGQGRLAVCKKNFLPVWYVVCPGLTIDDCVTCNIYGTNWSERDILSRYAKTGNENYVRLLSVMDEFKVPSHMARLAASRTGTKHEQRMEVKHGDLVFTDADVQNASYKLKCAREIIDSIADVKNVRQVNLLRMAIIRCTKEAGYDQRRMKDVCFQNAVSYRDCVSLAETLAQLAMFYNRGKKKDFMDVYGTGSALKVDFNAKMNRYARGK